MAIPGQRFELDLDAPGFTFNPIDDATSPDLDVPFAVREVREHDAEAIPAAPSQKSSKSGFPEHKSRRNISAFKQRQQARPSPARPSVPTEVEPSDRAIANHVGKKYGVDLESQQKAEISEENTRRIAEMSVEDIEEARAELMRNLNPFFVERLLKRANIEEDQQQWPEDNPDEDTREQNSGTILDSATLEDTPVPTLPAHGEPAGPSMHFPVPPRSKDEYVPLDPNDPAFFSELKSHYFPDTPHDPSSMTWLQDPTEEEKQDSLYNPEKESYLTSALRFGFNGRLIPPKESLEIDVKEGLHHHGEAPSSAGYTIPELAMLSRSTLPNQRCIAYQILGRVLYRLGRGDFGPRGSELHEALWSVIEKEKPVEVMMAEANRQGGHVSAKAHATEALWLWRKGGGGDRGVLKPGQTLGR
ncbi:RPAP1-like protein [Exophiala viscosa]|uniref:RPAP1-like protein n=1 Tax=Exophiala viscosa TaxID=2486360 RepID=UPI00219A21F6|nr:RPAP1-like protein [Exophiala viscosa]